jgi:hypothetical protein
MGKSNILSNGVLNVIFNGATFAGLFENASSAPITTLYVSLHTASPGAAGNQSTNEAAYPGYGRVAVARTTSGWPATSSQSISPAAAITFPVATGGGETETYAAVGTAATGTGELLYFGPISPSLAVSIGVQPQLSVATVITES